ncbi:hypothetical protein P775_22885 [Puniceibacterium antarcticum]|uniref:Uncharacterized protein n=1 Tax=Puniceibacterium antarcticum TaxID=1206336 RepID=A0A2G8R8G6_9RHOB|nr:hypothetical protein P775_22885 [Puniceibacterium antarcticum]
MDDQASVPESAVIDVPQPDFGETVAEVLVSTQGAQPYLDAISAQNRTALA